MKSAPLSYYNGLSDVSKRRNE